MASPSRLTAAAEELVKAAYLDVKVEAYAEAQKETVSTIRDVETELKSLRGSNDSKFDAIHTLLAGLILKVDQLASNVQSINNTLSTVNENSKLEWAIDHAEYGSFAYYDNNTRRRAESSTITKQVLFAFRQGFGYYLPEKVSLTDNYYSVTSEKDRTEFETKLVNAIFDLTAKKPVIKDLNDRRCIYKE